MRDVAPARLSDAPLPHDRDWALWPGRTVQVAGAQIFVRAAHSTDPAAEPALFVHGLGGASSNWTDLAGYLREYLDIEAIDLMGHGRSGPAPDDNYSPEAQAAVVIAYLEQSRRGPVHLVANSMGGAVSIIVAAQRPDLLRTLTLISPAVSDLRPRIYPLRHDRRMAALVMPGIGGWAMRQGMRLPVEQQVKGVINLCFADSKRYPAQRLAEAVSEATARREFPWAADAFLRSVRGLAFSQFARGGQVWRALRRIPVPTLVIWGAHDRLVAPDLARHVAEAVPDATLLVLDDVGHTAMMEDPETTARAILGLVERHRAAG
jgi:pimeloyl-ACP methyl ester carboxylesterase